MLSFLLKQITVFLELKR